MDGKQGKQQHVVANHAAPGTDEPEAQEPGADEGADDAHAPHAQYIINKGSHGSAHALHDALHHDGHTIERLGHRHHAQHRGAQSDDLGILGEDAHEVRCEEEEHTAGNHHQRHFQGQDGAAQAAQALFVPGAQGVACQGGGRGLHTPAGDVEQGFDGVCNGVGGGGHIAQGVNHGCEGHIA